MKQQGFTVSSFARELDTNRQAVYRIFKSHSIDTNTLYRISIILRYDFFKLYTDNLSDTINNL